MFLSLLVVVIYYVLLTLTQSPQFLNPIFISIVASILFIFNTLGAYNFASEEVKNTAGVTDVGDLPFSRLVALYLFSFLVSLGFVTLFVVSIEILNDAASTLLSRFLILISVGFLLLFPFFEFYSLSEEGEESAIPAEFIIEAFMEDLSSKIRSRFLATVLAYSVLYLLPIFLLIQFLNTSLITAVLLWALVLPMANLGALAGSGLGEDLLTLKLVRKKRFWKDFRNLGWPKISFKDGDGSFQIIPKLELGRAFLVLFAIQALLTTLYFVLENVLDIIAISQGGALVTTFSVGAIFTLSILNKGRGALKEMLAVWNESGFKVTTLSMFLPVFVLMGVVLASILEVYANLTPTIQEINVLGAFGINKHPRLVLLFLILQNLIMLLSAAIVISNPPGSVERRLVWQIPDYYEDVEGWLVFYRKIRSEKALVALLELARKQISEDERSHEIFKILLQQTLQSDNETVRIAASKALFSVISKLKQADPDYYQMMLDALEDSSVGVKIFATRALKSYARFYTDEKIMELLLLVLSKLYDPDVSVAWEANRSLQTLIDEVPSLRGAIIGLIIRTVTRRSGGMEEQVLHFIHQVSRKSYEIGSLLISTLLTQLHLPETTAEQDEQIIEGLRQVLRARPSLAEELLGQILNDLSSPDVVTKRNAAKILSHLSSFHTSSMDTITDQLIVILLDEDIEVKRYALLGLKYSIQHGCSRTAEIFRLVKQLIDEFVENTDLVLASIDVIEEIVRSQDGFDRESFGLLSTILKKTHFPEAKVRVIKALSALAENQDVLAEDLFFIAENLITDNNEDIQNVVLDLLYRLAKNHMEMSRPIYRLIQNKLRAGDQERILRTIPILGVLGMQNQDLAVEILGLLEPFTKSPDWSIRNEAFEASFVIALRFNRFQKDLLDLITLALSDLDGRVSETALDAASELLGKKKEFATDFLKISQKLIRSRNIRNRQTGALLLGNIVERDLTLVDEALSLLPNLVNEEEVATRIVAKQVLKQIMDRIGRLKNIPRTINKGLDKIVTITLKGANHSSASIRRDAYEVMTIIAEAIPREPIADRIRRAIEKAQKRQEKDPALLEFLEECRIRAKPPVYYVKEEGKIKI